MLTDLGKFLRKLRVDHEHTLAHMANLLSTSPSRLSSVEHGRLSVPPEWHDTLLLHYSFSPEDLLRLNTLFVLEALSSREKEALKAALSVIYLDDSSDYINGLWDVIMALIGHDTVQHDSFSIRHWHDALRTLD